MLMRKRKAFTLVEILIALVISSLIGLSIMAIYSISARSFEIAQRKQTAMENARTSLEQISEWIKWGGFEFESSGFAGIYPCRNSPTDTAAAGICGMDFSSSFGIISELSNVKRRINLYFVPNPDTAFPDDALLMMEEIDISAPPYPVLNTSIISDRVMMPGTNMPNSQTPMTVPNFIEFYDINYNLLVQGDFPLSGSNGVLIKLSIVGINWSDFVDEDGNIADFVAVPYTVTVFTRNFMK